MGSRTDYLSYGICGHWNDCRRLGARFILSLNALFDLENNLFYMTLASIAAGILIFQMVFSSIWLKKFTMGPMELLWRIGTYGKIPDQYKRTSRV
ncbi:MAG: DUF418 domain-containing protein [Bacillota bacterium]